MSLKLLSVIIPAYNAEKYLAKCVESVAEQSYKNIEIVIVNNSSSDSTPEICEELKAKYNNRMFKIINLNPNQGINFARRAGVENASGDYTAFIDSDDYLDLEAYETAIKVLEENNADMVQFGIKLVDLDGKILRLWQHDAKIFNQTEEIYKYFMTNPVPTWNVWDKVYKRNLFENLEWLKISALEDYCVSAQLFARAKKFIIIDNLFYNYLQRSDSTLRLKSIEQNKHDDMRSAMDLVIDVTGKNFPALLPEAIWRKLLFTERIFMDYAAANSKENINNLIKNMREIYSEFKAELKNQNSNINLRPEAAYKSIYLNKYRAKTWVFINLPKLAVLYSKIRLKIKDLFKI